jgi:hypothetical protein
MQSHFVKLEPPYQIIHYGGVVGIQIGTLIVVSESYPGDHSNIEVYTHSHPVVSYVDKYQLKEKLAQARGNLAVASRFGGGEGNVWSKVEVSDVDVIGLWDADQEEVSCSFEWNSFLSLVLHGFSLMDAQNGTYRNNGIFDLESYLRRVGLTPVLPPPIKRLEMGLSLHCTRHRDGFVRLYIQCNELFSKDSDGFLRIAFNAMYDEKHIGLVVDNIKHHMQQFLSLLRMHDAKIEFTISDDDNDDELVGKPEDVKNLEIIADRLNDIYNKKVHK